MTWSLSSRKTRKKRVSKKARRLLISTAILHWDCKSRTSMRMLYGLTIVSRFGGVSTPRRKFFVVTHACTRK